MVDASGRCMRHGAPRSHHRSPFTHLCSTSAPPNAPIDPATALRSPLAPEPSALRFCTLLMCSAKAYIPHQNPNPKSSLGGGLGVARVGCCAFARRAAVLPTCLDSICCLHAVEGCHLECRRWATNPAVRSRSTGYLITPAGRRRRVRTTRASATRSRTRTSTGMR
jgi:hypothetical protein